MKAPPEPICTRPSQFASVRYLFTIVPSLRPAFRFRSANVSSKTGRTKP